VLLLAVWVLGAVIAGAIATRLRRRVEHAFVELQAAKQAADQVNASLERILETAPAFHTEGSTTEVAAAICTAARETFTCDAASLWRVVDDGLLELILRRPAAATLPPGISFAVQGRVRTQMLDEHHAAFGVDQPPLDVARGVGTRSVLRVPIVLGGEVTLVLALAWAEVVPEPRPESLVVVQRFADQAAFALEQARRREAQGEAEQLYKRLETGLLPTLLVRDASLQIATRYEAGEDRLLLGGDFYDAVELHDGSLAVLIGDVSGHGPDAAALGANLRAAWRALVLGGIDAPALAGRLQEVLERERATPETFVTCCLVFVDADRSACTVLLAGHPGPILTTAGEAQPLHARPGPPLGMVPDATWSCAEHALPDAWGILLYTDGLTDVRVDPAGTARLGADGLLEQVRAVEATPADLLGGGLDRLLQRVRTAGSDRFPDDVAILLVAYGPG
jgi:serine phosphatase RsbU (regulator of sigma subunit)